MKCMVCGKELIGTSNNDLCMGCYKKQQNEDYCRTEKLYTGWICPKCGSVWAPQVEGCDYCNGPQLNPEIQTIDEGGTNRADKTKP